jgi:hypothetical protein
MKFLETPTECSIEKITLTSYKNFWGSLSKEFKSEMLQIGRYGCEKLINENLCDGSPMTCKEKTCFLDKTPKETYTWLGTTTEVGYKCIVKPRATIAKNAEDYLFGEKCKITEKNCQLQNSVIVWEDDVITSSHCPYSYITSNDFIRLQQSVLYDELNARAFKIISKSKPNKCEFDIYGTQENVFITFSKEAKKLKSSEVDLSALHELILSEQDGSSLRLVNAMKGTKKRLCEHLATFLRIFALIPNKFTVFAGNNGEETVFFTDKGQVFIPPCQRTNRIWLYEHKTYKDEYYRTPEELDGIAVEAEFATSQGIQRKRGRWVTNEVIRTDTPHATYKGYAWP